jgi:hypothetical protein
MVHDSANNNNKNGSYLKYSKYGAFTLQHEEHAHRLQTVRFTLHHYEASVGTPRDRDAQTKRPQLSLGRSKMKLRNRQR